MAVRLVQCRSTVSIILVPIKRIRIKHGPYQSTGEANDERALNGIPAAKLC